MSSPPIDSVKIALSSKHYTVNESWLQECVDFYVNEHRTTSLDSLLSFIISQWQLSDLREINNEKGCLPNNLATQKCITLPGKYILQMDCIYDISTPKYKQLEKIRNVSTENIEVTEFDNVTQFNTQNNAQSGYSNWEPKPKRMMHLKLTDGKQNITAIECKRIHLFDDLSKLLPGFKIMVKGPVICRKGLILLEEQNLIPIGGEVDRLLIPNAIENILARALKLKENPNPYSEINTQNGANSTNDNNRTSQITRNPATSQYRSNNSSTNNDRSNISTTNVTYNTSQPSTSTSTNQTNANQQINVDDMFQDEFNDIDFNALDEEIERKNLNSNSNKQLQSLNNVQKTNLTATSRKSQEKKAKTPQESNDWDDIDNFEIMEIEKATSNWCNTVSFPTAAKTETNASRSNKYTEETVPSKSVTKYNNATPSTSGTNTKCDAVMDLNDDDWDSFQIPKLSANANIKTASTISSRDIVRSTPSTKQDSHANIFQTKSNTGNQNVSKDSKGSNSRQKRSCDNISPPIKTNPQKVRCSEEAMKMRKITDFVKPLNTSNTPTHFCDLLCDVMAETLSPTPVKRTIRGKVVEVSKLKVDNSQWCLTGILTDDTSRVDVTFSSEVLDRIFGFTVEEFQKKKRMKKQNPEIMNSLKQDLKVAEQKLIELDALVELEFSKNNKTVVTKISELSAEQKKQINARIANSKKKG